jgi:amino acid adenylation domain-containing protein/non-ribosomal peptide synthase protein (TIGR01720 family)
MAINNNNLLTADEKIYLLETLNSTKSDFSTDKSIVDLFEDQVVKNPNALALIFKDTKLTYSELNIKSNELSHYLINNYDIQPDDLVGIELERSEWMVIGIMAIIKSGGAYVPIDPDYPEVRKSFIKSDANLKVILNHNELEKFKTDFTINNYLNTNPNSRITPSNLAYVIYTSGSTGNPKGCMLEHRGLVNRLEWMQKTYPLTENDTILQKTTFTFDVSVWELFWWSLNGASVSLLEPEGEKIPEKIISEIENSQVTVMHFVPSMLSVFLEYLTQSDDELQRLSSLRQVYTSGEALQVEQVKLFKKLLPEVKLMNLYGPTEASIDVSYYSCEIVDDRSIPIGKPIDNTSLYVLDVTTQALVPFGSNGEICIGGIGLARGYLNRSELTSEKFIANPYKKGERLYRTGDLGRWREDGNLEYLGRLDDQVKIRGFRIETGEIEQVLTSHPNSGQVVVIARSLNNTIDKELITYSTGAASATELKAYLIERLPYYMVPNYYVKLDTLPLTKNGKLNKKELPDPIETGLQVADYVEPKTDTQIEIVNIWSDVLRYDVNKIGLNSDFFDLGGNSIKAIRILGKIHKSFGVKYTIKDFFANSIISQFSQLIDQNKHDKSFFSIPLTNIKDIYPLSAAQNRLWILCQFEGANQAYLMPFVNKLNFNVDLSVFENAYEFIINRHEILRTIFFTDELGNPFQKILKYSKDLFSVCYKDFSKSKSDEINDLVANFIEFEITSEIDISNGPLIRCILIKENEQTYSWVLILHHLIGDGWSMDVFFQEFGELYFSEIEKRQPNLSYNNVNYKDYSVWHNDLLKSEVLAIDKEYWIKKFSNEVPVIQFPNDSVRPQKMTYGGSNYYYQFDKNTSQSLRFFCNELSGTKFLTLQTALTLLLHKYTGLEDIVIGTPVSDRDHNDLDRLIGFFVNTIPLRSQFSSDDTLEELYNNIKDGTLDSFSHKSFPYDALVDTLKIKRDISRNPLFDILLLVQNEDDRISSFNQYLDKNNLYSRLNGQGFNSARYDISIEFVENIENDYLSINYKTEIFNETQINRICKTLEYVLQIMSVSRFTKIKDIDLIDQDEKIYLLETLNSTKSDFSTDKSIVDLFEDQVVKYPNALALIFKDTKLTYSELNIKSNELSHYLINNYDIQPDDLVGIELERSEWMVIGIMAIIKSGGAYVPIDPDYPEVRKSFIKSDANLKVILNHNELEKFKTDFTINNYLNTNPNSRITPSNLAYVIYTSGSTGNPKGCMLEHRGLVNRLEWMQKTYPLTENDTILQKTTFTFDVSVWELFWWSLNGASVSLLEPEGEKIPEKIISEIENSQVTVMHFVPSMLSVFLEYLTQSDDELQRLSSLRQVYTSGEALQVEQVKLFKKLLPEVKLMNLYGPTEASIDVSYYSCEIVDDRSIPIGKPIDNTSLYVLDVTTQALVPFGSNGEICIGGIGLARGYLNRSELTSEKFIANPYKKGERLYRTGDLGRWREDGNLEYLGRLDDQVKIRGFRIETGEIEQVLTSHPNSGQVVVIARSLNNTIDKELITYSTGAASATELKAYLIERLPYYMVPNYYVKLDTLPLTKNGKLNKKELPDPIETGLQVADYIAPTTILQRTLATIWSDVLRYDVNKIGLNSDFFDLGGDSIKSIQIAYKLRNQGLKVRLSDIMLNGNFKFQASQIQEIDTALPQNEASGRFQLGPFQQLLLESRFFDGINSGNWYFNQSNLVELPNWVTNEYVEIVWDKLISHHDSLRLKFIKENNQWIQEYIKNDNFKYKLQVRDLRGIDSFQIANTIKQESIQVKTLYNVNEDPNLILVVFNCNDCNRLLISINHLVIDTVSWNIIFEDFNSLLTQIRDGNKLELPQKTNSYKYWIENHQTKDYREYLKFKLPFWDHSLTCKNEKVYKNRLGHKGLKSKTYLSKEYVSRLNRILSNNPYININSIFIYALAKSQFIDNSFTFYLEGHGREENLKDINIERTIGWFTSLYPVSFENTNCNDDFVNLSEINNRVNQASSIASSFLWIERNLSFENAIIINYSGKVELEYDNISISSFDHGPERSPNLLPNFDAELNIEQNNEILIFDFEINEFIFGNNIDLFVTNFRDNFIFIINYLEKFLINNVNKSIIEFGNFGLKDSSVLNSVTESSNLFFPCNKMQKGLFSYNKVYPESYAYCEKYSLSISGSFNQKYLRSAFYKLIDENPILKSNFTELENGEIIQIINDKTINNFSFIDLSSLNNINSLIEIERLEKELESIRYNLESDSLFNLTIIKLNDFTHHFIWTQHHIILDGWSNSILKKYFFENYNKLISKIDNELPSNSKLFLKSYHQWLRSFDSSLALKYWHQYLTSAEPSSIVPNSKFLLDSNVYDRQDYIKSISPQLLFKIYEVAKLKSISVTSIFNYAWSVLLAKYNNKDKVSFGTVVSGRDISVFEIDKAIGLFINTIPVVVDFSNRESHYQISSNIMKHLIGDDGINNLSFVDILDCSEFGKHLIDHVLVFENFPDFEKDILSILNRNDGDYKFSEKVLREFNQSNYDLSIAFIFKSDSEMSMKFVYNENNIEREYIVQLQKHFINSLESIISNYDNNIFDVDILDKDEQFEIMRSSSGEKIELKPNTTIIDYFYQNVLDYPDKIALLLKDKSFTFQELNSLSNQFANYLIENYKPEVNQLIPIKLERTEWFFISVLAIHKIGAAYVPIDPAYPKSRIDFILNDIKSKFIIDELEIDEFSLQRSLFSKVNINCNFINEQLAYCIYTSGSTGDPKGVLIDHNMLLASNIARLTYYDNDSMQRGLLLYSFAFDSSVNLTFKMLVSGGTIVLYEENEINLDLVISIINEKQIDTITIPPGLYDVLLDCEDCPSLKNIIVAGEECRSELVFKHYLKYPQVNLYNEYGPTECTVWSTVYKTSNKNYTKIPIGKPIANVSNFVIDKWGYLMPVGLKGELCIAGPTVGKGYLNNVNLTEQKFVMSNRYNQRYYRTGDYCYWNNDFQLVFSGRIDNQIKIRGYRVELGEIETIISKINDVQNVVVTVKGVAPDMQIVCFYVGTVEVTNIQEILKQELPEYMVPSIIVQLDELPLTPHLKIDTKFLLESLNSTNELNDYLEFNETQENLATVWSLVLKKELKLIGYNSDFFNLGGDSIKAIMLISKLRKFGLELKISEVMDYSIFSDMSDKLRATTRIINQDVVIGEFPLLPMQKLFLENDFISGDFNNKNYFLQGNLFELSPEANKEILEIAIQKLFDHHDSLRAKILFTETIKKQLFDNNLTKSFSIEEFDFLDAECQNIESTISDRINELNMQFDFVNGPVTIIAIFNFKDCKLLYFSIHHLFVDLVSWRILIEDLNQLLEQLINGQKIELPPKTDSSIYWVDQMVKLIDQGFYDNTIEYWNNIENSSTERLVSTHFDGVLLSNSTKLNIEFNKEETKTIKDLFNNSNYFDIQSLLVYVLGRTFNELFGLKKVKINLEGHGRDDSAGDFDLTRTVGWFTNSFPLLVDFSEGNDLEGLLYFQNYIENIPYNGISYGWLKYTNKFTTSNVNNYPLIDFNYHGEYYENNKDTSFIKVFDSIKFNDDGNNLTRNADFIINSMIISDFLKIEIAFYNQNEFEKLRFEFTNLFKNKIFQIINEIDLVSLDRLIGLKQNYPEISFEKINSICSIHGDIDDIYSLTPMQLGLFYLNTSGVHKEAYFEQFEYLVNGNINIDYYKEAFIMLFNNNDVLRVIFDEDQNGKPLQIVKNKIDIDFIFEIVNQSEFNSKKHEIKSFEIERGFNLNEGPLLRMKVLFDGLNKYFILWNSHHIILDGWSMAVLFAEFQKNYFSLVNGMNLPLIQRNKFGDYVRHIESLHNEKSLDFWSKKIGDYENEIQIPGIRKNENKSYLYAEETIELSKELSAGLVEICNSSKTTLNNLMQVLWALILCKYNNTNDVVFGSIVSGRNVDLENVESVVGLSINMIPIRINYSVNDTLIDLLKKTQDEYIESLNYHFNPISEVQNLTQLGSSLINHFTVFENYPENNSDEYHEVHKIDKSSILVSEQNNYDFSLIFEPGKNVKIKVCYNKNAVEKWTINNLKSHWNCILKWVINNSSSNLSSLEIYSDFELNHRKLLLESLDVSFPESATIISIFEDVCLKHSKRTALVFDNEDINYQELNIRVNKLANYLKVEHNIQKGDFVSILLPRGNWAIISILAIAKCGGVYVPVDVNYPKDRIDYIKNDSNSKLLLDDQFLSVFLARYIEISSDFKPCNLLPEDSLYVIYTSGTTGKPKGTIISHLNVVRLFFNENNLFTFNENDTWLLFHSYCFDFSVWEMFGALLYGGKLIIPSYEVTRDVELFHDLIDNSSVTILNQTPSAFYLLDEYLKEKKYPKVKLKKIIFGGEALNPQRLKNWHQSYPEIELINMYGITETTVHVTYKKLLYNDLENGISNIGSAIPTLACLILGSNGEMLPFGSVGEIYVLGAGLSKEYLNKPELTDEKFVINKTLGLKTYKTGDLGRYINDTDIEYFGRIDNQVKVRGHRIELSEIEAMALENKLIRNALAIINKSYKSSGEIVLYYVGEIDINEIRQFLFDNLPDFMVPSYFVNIERIPLNNNGKVDISKLPTPIPTLVLNKFIAESNSEKLLCEIFMEVLKINEDAIGVNTSFISLGGDSIKSIQVISKLRANGFKIKVADIMKMLSIKSLAKKLEVHNQVEISKITPNKFNISPVQHFFLNNILVDGDFKDKHFFNQSYLFDLNDKYSLKFIEDSIFDLICHHDSLRLKFINEEGIYYSKYQDKEGTIFNIIELTIPNGLSDSDLEDYISDESLKIKKSLNITDGPLIKGLLFQEINNSRLLLTCHHLLIDLVSWRIIIDDLNFILKTKKQDNKIILPEKGSSYFQWIEGIEKYANSRKLQNQIEYWNNVLSIPGDKINQQLSEGRFPLTDFVDFKLSLEETKKLLSSLTHCNQIEINSLLLHAVGSAAITVLNLNNVKFNLEGHGREEFNEEIQILRTVGWFTSIFPFNIGINDFNNNSINDVVELNSRLNNLPSKGFGFGILMQNNYLDKNNYPDYNSIEFNYMGSFYSNSENDQNQHVIKISKLNHGLESNPNLKSGSVLSIGSMIYDDQFSMKIWFNVNQLQQDLMKTLSDQIQFNLNDLVLKLLNANIKLKTSDDFNYKGISNIKLSQLEEFYGPIQDVLKLTPLQRGIYFHSELDNDPEMYYVQFGFLIKGLKNVDLYTNSIKKVLSSYDILRVIYTKEFEDLPMQIVKNQTDLNIEITDISELPEKKQREFLDNYFVDQRKSPFNLNTGDLIRINLFKTDNNNYYLLWSNHHIILDGWSTQILLNEIYQTYSNYIDSKYKSLSIKNNNIDFKQYIEWLDNYDFNIANEFWKDYLKDFEPSLDPFTFKKKSKNAFAICDSELLFDIETTENLYKIAAQLNLTVSSIFQGLWSVIYSKYCDSDDIVFGVVTSGRPSNLDQVESIVGALINTIPFRVKIDKTHTLKEHFYSLQNTFINVEPFQYIGLSEIQNAAGFSKSLFSNAIVFENYPVNVVDINEQSTYNIDNQWNHVFEKNSYNLSLIVLPEKSLKVIFKYNTNAVSDITINTIKKSFNKLLNDFIFDSSKSIRDIELLDLDSQLEIVNNCTDYDITKYDNSKTILEQYYSFIKDVDSSAIIFQNKHYSYSWLENESNRFAGYLRYKLGIDQKSMVMVQLPRSQYLQVVLLGILKNSCAYIPISIDEPASRIDFIKEDCGSNILITNNVVQNFIDDFDIYPTITDMPDGKDLMYCLYTSGSTGQPKGCLLEHHSLYNRLNWMQNAYSLEPNDIILQKTPYTFDVSVWELFWWLMYGAKICVLDHDAEKDPEAIVNTVYNNNVTVLHFVPSMLTAFLEFLESSPESIIKLKSIKQIFTSGEALLGFHVRRLSELLPDAKLMNLYGPTEASIDVSYYDCALWDGETEEIPIGKPIFNTGLLILDSEKKLLPIGFIGEIAISGSGLARGYLNRTDLTQQKFVTHPTNPNQKIYLTGDLGRWNIDGQLDYLGRIDDQVKIRGNRIELGEITSKVLNFEGVKDAVVIAKKINLSTQLELVAYIVGTVEFSKIKKHLSDNLPSYMIPNHFVSLDSIPLNSSGKVNRKQLPEPSTIVIESPSYLPPSNPLEIHLAEVWSIVLQKNLGSIGINSDFFDLGGDSIKAIQVVSKLRAQGLTLKLSDVISNTILEQQAKFIQKSIKEIPQQIEMGYFELSPIQHLFLNNGFMDGEIIDKSLFNQSYLFEIPDWLNQDKLQLAWDKIMLHHDALRIRFNKKNDIWTQEYTNLDSSNYQLQTFDLRILDSDSCLQSITKYSEFVKKSNNLDNGLIVNLGYFLCNDSNRLLISIHHLVVDIVSWQIIIDDLNSLFFQIYDNKSLNLGLKTESYKNWIQAHYKNEYINKSSEYNKYWDDFNNSSTNNLLSEFYPKDSLSNWKNYERTCDKIFKSQFIQISKKKKSIKSDILLLYSVSKALNKTFGEGLYLCYVESHGRIDNTIDIDITRTVGWFTDMFPVLLNTKTSDSEINEFLKFHDIIYQQIEFRTSFLWNRLLTANSDPRPNDKDFIEFNFLGDIKNEEELQKSILKEMDLYTGPESSQNLIPKSRMIIVCGFVNGILRYNVSSSSNYFSGELMLNFINYLENYTLELITTLNSFESSLKSAADFAFNRLTFQEIKSIEHEYGELEDIYELSPMQKGLYYLGIYNEKDESYCVQFGEKYIGNVNPDFFKESIIETINTNPSTRAIFRSDFGIETLQIIPKNSDIDYEYLDLSENNFDKIEYCLNIANKERSCPFDFSKGKLLRVKLFKLDEKTFYFLWTNHHIILDGWSTGILLAEIRSRLNHKLENLQYKNDRKPLFSNYVKWLGQQNMNLSLDFWKNKLIGYTNIAEIKGLENIESENNNFYTIDFEFKISENITKKLEHQTRKLKTTLNTMMQAAYGVLLSHYTKNYDVVFGAIVSGRPTQIDDIEKMVGLLFNTIPLRVKFDINSNLSALLNDIQKFFIESQDHHYLNVSDFNKLGNSLGNPIRSLLTFENYPTEEINCNNFLISNEDKFIFEQTNYDLSTIIIPGNELQFIIKYNPNKYSDTQINEIQTLFELILNLMANYDDISLKLILIEIESKIADKNKVGMERQKQSNLSKLKNLKK